MDGPTFPMTGYMEPVVSKEKTISMGPGEVAPSPHTATVLGGVVGDGLPPTWKPNANITCVSRTDHCYNKYTYTWHTLTD